MGGSGWAENPKKISNVFLVHRPIHELGREWAERCGCGQVRIRGYYQLSSSMVSLKKIYSWNDLAIAQRIFSLNRVGFTCNSLFFIFRGAGNCRLGFPYVCQYAPCSVGYKDCWPPLFYRLFFIFFDNVREVWIQSFSYRCMCKYVIRHCSWRWWFNSSGIVGTWSHIFDTKHVRRICL